MGNKLHVNILSNIASKIPKYNDYVLQPVYRSSNTPENLIKYAGLYMETLLLSRRNSVVHVIYPAHKLSIKLAEKLMRKNIKVVFHWIGSDVLLAVKKGVFSNHSKLMEYVEHVTVAPWLKDELEDNGVHVTGIIPLVPLDLKEKLSGLVSHLPDEFVVGYYVPEGKEDLYNKQFISEFKNAYSQKKVKMIVLGSIARSSEANIEYWGLVKRNLMADFYRKIMLLVRYVRHDGLSQMVIETLLSGRYVIYNKPLRIPCVYYATDTYDIMEKINKLYLSYANGDLKPNYICVKGVLEKFNPEKIGRQLESIWSLQY